MYIDDNSEFNQVGVRFGVNIKNELQASIMRMIGPRATGKLYSAIKEKYGYDDAGELFKIGWIVLRYGILHEKGVGKEVGMKNGVRYPTAKNNTGIIRRKQNPWISNVISDERIMQLADELAAARANTEVKKYYHAIFDDMTINGKKI